MKNEAQLNWEKQKQKGKSHYLITRGVLPYGIGLTILLGLIEYLSQTGSISIWTPIRLIIFCYLGFILANGRWQAKERKFNQ